MTPENFCYWLQGWFELNRTVENKGSITNDTLKVIEDHLNLVFKKVTPDPTPTFGELLSQGMKKHTEETRYC